MKNLADYIYYHEPGPPDIKIYHGDCLEVMPLLEQVDLTVTDPPYGMSFQSNHREQKHEKIHGDSELPIETIKYALSMANRGGMCFADGITSLSFQSQKVFLRGLKITGLWVI